MLYLIALVISTWTQPAADFAVQEPTPAGTPASSPEGEGPSWEFSDSVFYSDPPDSDARLTAILYAKRGPLHLELRYNYEDLQTASLFTGWTFDWDGEFAGDITPMLGVVAGDTDGIAPGVEINVAWKRLAFYSEAEYLFDSHDSDDDFFYSWSTLMYGVTDWLDAGVVAERSKTVDTGLSVQRGLALGFAFRNVDVSIYAYNLDSDDFYAVVALGIGI